jgi:hypothetical protein
MVSLLLCEAVPGLAFPYGLVKALAEGEVSLALGTLHKLAARGRGKLPNIVLDKIKCDEGTCTRVVALTISLVVLITTLETRSLWSRIQGPKKKLQWRKNLHGI